MVFYCVQRFVSRLDPIIHHPHVIQKQWSYSLNVKHCDMLWINVCVFFLLLRLQIVLIMWSKRSKSSRRRCHSPLNRREVPTPPQATEETHLVASPASSWVETVIFHPNAFLFFKDKNPPPPLSSSSSFCHILPAFTYFTCTPAVTSVDPRVLSLHPQTFCLDPFFY